MTEKIVVGNGVLCTFDPDNGEIIQNGAVAFEGDTIVGLGDTASIKGQFPEFRFVDADGMLICPGFICGHSHFYGMFARGMPLKDEPPSNFLEVLERLWWRLDKVLDEKSTYYSAVVCIEDAIRNGCTTILDHHASPNYITGSLDTIAKATLKAGVRTCLCYEVTDRNGEEGADLGIKENVRFIERLEREPNPLLAASFGLHASFTVSDGTLAKCVEAAKGHDVGFHIHVAEGIVDVDDCVENYSSPVIYRLHERGLLGSRTLAIHGVHTSPEEHQILAETGTCLMHCPQSNMNNGVGVAHVPAMIEKGVLVGMGTDGVTHDMIAECKAAYFVHKLAVFDPRPMGADPLRLLMENNSKIASRFFSKPVGVLKVGAFADLVLLDYSPPTPLSKGNMPWHLQFGMSAACVHSTICGGKFLMRDRKLETLDSRKLRDESRKLAPEVWGRF